MFCLGIYRYLPLLNSSLWSCFIVGIVGNKIETEGILSRCSHRSPSELSTTAAAFSKALLIRGRRYWSGTGFVVAWGERTNETASRSVQFRDPASASASTSPTETKTSLSSWPLATDTRIWMESFIHSFDRLYCIALYCPEVLRQNYVCHSTRVEDQIDWSVH